MKFPATHAVEQIGWTDASPRPNWKPFVFSPLYIIPLSIFHLLSIVGIQLLIKQYDEDADKIAPVKANRTLDEAPSSLFIFEEDDTRAFMAWAYLPVAIMIVLSFGWEALDVKLRRLEPFRQLACREGGTAWNALCVDYTSLFGLFTPFKAFQRRHFTVALTSTIYVISSIALPAVANGIFVIEWGSLSFSSGRDEGKKYAIVEVNRGIALANQVLHGLLLAGGFAVSVSLLIRHSGLYHDPSSIGGLATLLSDATRSGSTAARLFRQIPSFVHSKVVERALADIVFRLEHVQITAADGSLQSTYQLTADVSQYTILNIDLQDRRFYADRNDALGRWLRKRSAWVAEIFIWLGPATISGAIYGTAKVIAGDVVTGSRPMIAKLVMTVLVTLGSMMWTSIQRDIQLFAPWRSLSKLPERSLSTAIWRHDPVGQGQFGSAAFGIRRGSAAIVWASFCVLMTQAIAVFAPTIMELAWAAGVTGNMNNKREVGVLTGSSGLALGASAVGIHLVIFLNLLIFSFSSLSRPFMPRAPRTVASQILYLCRSERLLRKFEGTSTMKQRELSHLLKSAQGSCLLGWFWWREGGAWCVGIEEQVPGAVWYPFDFNRGVAGGQPCS